LHVRASNDDLVNRKDAIEIAGNIIAKLQTHLKRYAEVFQILRRTQGCYHIKLIKENYEIETTGYKETPRPKILYVKPLSSRKLAKYIGFNLTDIPIIMSGFTFKDYWRILLN
jgi:hypothetical protein